MRKSTLRQYHPVGREDLRGERQGNRILVRYRNNIYTKFYTRSELLVYSTLLPKLGKCPHPLRQKPEERHFVIDSGASMRMLRKKDMSSGELEKLLGTDHEIRESTLRQYEPFGSEDLSVELQRNSDEPQPAETKDDAEARNDFWLIEGDFIYRHHVEP